MAQQGNTLDLAPRRGPRVGLAAIVSAWAIATVSAATAQEIPLRFDRLSGQWEGWGVMRLAGGQVERVKCIAKFDAREDNLLHHDFRCASKSLRIDVMSDLRQNGRRITGHWREKVFAVDGGVRGRAMPRGFALQIDGPNFSADLTVTVSQCRQTMTIVPVGFRARKISIGLTRTQC